MSKWWILAGSGAAIGVLLLLAAAPASEPAPAGPRASTDGFDSGSEEAQPAIPKSDPAPRTDPTLGPIWQRGYQDGLLQVRYIRAPYPPGPDADAYAAGYARGSEAAAEPVNKNRGGT